MGSSLGKICELHIEHDHKWIFVNKYYDSN
uniref:Uncharacterized protein n=1 Tax=Rhizophora mucronata TaxID=61149 RepID=A0A2P2NYU4_RHIMU